MSPLYLTGEINEEMLGKTLEYLHRYGSSYPLKVYMCSFGGDVLIAKQIYDLLNNKNATIHVYGACQSGAVHILAAGAKRLSTSSCEFMVHYGEESAETAAQKRYNARMHRFMKQTLYPVVNVSKATVSRWLNGEKTFTAEEALKVGLIQEIVDL